jgi:hypothetical protein
LERYRRTRRGLDIRPQAAVESAIGYLRDNQITLIFAPAVGTLHAGTGTAARTITLKAS